MQLAYESPSLFAGLDKINSTAGVVQTEALKIYRNGSLAIFDFDIVTEYNFRNGTV